MYASTPRTPLALFGLAAIFVGVAGVALTSQGLPVATLALTLILVSFLIMILSPRRAVMLLALTRFVLDMAWDERIGGLGVLDVLGAGIPVATLVVYALRRPHVMHLPLTRALLGWTASVWVLAGIHVLGGGDPLTALENSLRFTSGVSVFFLTIAVVPGFKVGLKLTAFWLLGTIPVLAVFFAVGSSNAMDYHGVLRHRALFFDVVTPALVGFVALMTSYLFFAIAWRRRSDPRWIAALAIYALVACRMIFLTFSNATAGITILATVMLLVHHRKYVLIGVVCLIVMGIAQLPAVQQRWWREVAIASGEVDPIAFASGRPNRWRRHYARFERLPTTGQVLGVHGAWGNPESQPLQLLTDLGYAGGTLTLAFLFYVLLSIWRWRREETDPERRLYLAFVSSAAVGSVAGWVTMTMLCMVNFQWWFFSCLGVAAVSRQQRLDELRAQPAR